jgi:hypothetical protein
MLLEATRLILNVNGREFDLIRPSPCQNEMLESKILLMNTHRKNSSFLLTIMTTYGGCSRKWSLLRRVFRDLKLKYKRQTLP